MWRCNAKPTALDGATCGSENELDDARHCSRCGCTRKASDRDPALPQKRDRVSHGGRPGIIWRSASDWSYILWDDDKTVTPFLTDDIVLVTSVPRVWVVRARG